MKKLSFVIVFLFFLSTLLCFADNKTILVIESYHAQYPWDISYKKGLENILGNDYSLVHFEMDTKRLPASQYEERAQLAFEIYEKQIPYS